MGLEQPGRYAATRTGSCPVTGGCATGGKVGRGAHRDGHTCSVRASAPIGVSSMWGSQGRLLALRARVLPGEAALTHVNLTTSRQQKALIPASRPESSGGNLSAGREAQVPARTLAGGQVVGGCTLNTAAWAARQSRPQLPHLLLPPWPSASPWLLTHACQVPRLLALTSSPLLPSTLPMATLQDSA